MRSLILFLISHLLGGVLGVLDQELSPLLLRFLGGDLTRQMTGL